MFKKIPKGYGLNECPPLREAIALGFTHLPVLLLNTVPIPLLIGGGKVLVGFKPAEWEAALK